jgi:hypothetical protein
MSKVRAGMQLSDRTLACMCKALGSNSSTAIAKEKKRESQKIDPLPNYQKFPFTSFILVFLYICFSLG